MLTELVVPIELPYLVLHKFQRVTPVSSFHFFLPLQLILVQLEVQRNQAYRQVDILYADPILSTQPERQ